MPHGTPDWGLVGPKAITYGLDDLGEAVARLGSPHLWDRRGDVLYVTDFREGLGMMAYTSNGTGAGVFLVTGHSRLGAYAVNLRAGSDGARFANLHVALPFQASSCVGLECSFSLHVNSSYMRWDVYWLDGAVASYGGVVYDHVAQQLRYRTTGDVWQVLAGGVGRHASAHPEHTMKVVVDMGIHEYVRFLLDELAYDMRGIPVYVTPAPAAPYWGFAIEHYGVALQNPDSYVDSVIITQNEPW